MKNAVSLKELALPLFLHIRTSCVILWLDTMRPAVPWTTLQVFTRFFLRTDRKFYIDETGRAFEKRINEQRYARESNAYSIHLRDEGHQLNWRDAKLIRKSSTSYERFLVLILTGVLVNWEWMTLPR